MHLHGGNRHQGWFNHLATRIADWQTHGPRPVGSRDKHLYPQDEQFPKWWHKQLEAIRNADKPGPLAKPYPAEKRALVTYLGMEVTPSIKPHPRVSQNEHVTRVEQSTLYFDDIVKKGMRDYQSFYMVRDMYYKGALQPELVARLDRQYFAWRGTRELAPHEWDETRQAIERLLRTPGSDLNNVKPDYVDECGFGLGRAITRLKLLRLRHRLALDAVGYCLEVGLDLTPPDNPRWRPAHLVRETFGGGRPPKQRHRMESKQLATVH